MRSVNNSIFENFKEYESDRMRFVKLTGKYSNEFFRLRSDEGTMMYIDRPPLESLDEAEKLIEFFEEEYKNRKAVTWAAVEKKSGLFMGYICFWNLKPEHFRLEVGYMFLPEFWNKGYMTEALRTIIPAAFEEMNYHSVEADVNPANEASKRVLEKLGFSREAYFRENYYNAGKFLDSVIYSLLEGELK